MRVVQRALLLIALLFVAGAVATFVASVRTPANGANPEARTSPTRPVADTDSQIDRLQIKLRLATNDATTLAQLGELYLQKTRETGDSAFYIKAEQALQQALGADALNADALRGLASVANGRHDFQSGRDLAQMSLDADPDNPRTYGVLGDSLVELGRYDEALDAFQHMLDLKPDLSAYARASYLRELHGDVQGAIEAMRTAVASGGPTGEGVAWVHTQLGHLYYTYGDIDAAEREYTASLDAFPGFVHGEAGLAKVLAARGNTAGAIAKYRDVVQRYPVLEYIVALQDLYDKRGDNANATQQRELVAAIEQLMRSNGVNGDLELALYYANHDVHLEEALVQATAEYGGRPSTQAADILGWTLYKNRQYEEAMKYSDEALRLGSRDPLLAFHAGMIREKLGDTAGAKELLARALNTNRHFSFLYADVARDTLDRLG